MDGNKVTDAERVMVSTPSSAVQPDWKALRCHCDRWFSYDLTAPSYEALQDELRADRRTCDSFLHYRRGWSPDEHRNLVLQKEELRVRVLLLLLGAVVGFVLGFLGP
jgi:hypothetical protein